MTVNACFNSLAWASVKSRLGSTVTVSPSARLDKLRHLADECPSLGGEAVLGLFALLDALRFLDGRGAGECLARTRALGGEVLLELFLELRPGDGREACRATNAGTGRFSSF